MALCRDAGQEDVDAGDELIAVVVLAQPCRRRVYERVPAGAQLRPSFGGVVQEGRSVRVAAGAAPDVRGVLPGYAHDGFHGGVGNTEVIIDRRTGTLLELVEPWRSEKDQRRATYLSVGLTDRIG
ncbi:hypothetical protein [Streptomyces sp. NPDC058683]|uniref:hypothetical protein n=1 Tax=Streptomyces sp. NPDC058683 TaxID=3346597 RepID=UPI00365B16D0